jgi:hypothetical protein
MRLAFVTNALISSFGNAMREECVCTFAVGRTTDVQFRMVEVGQAKLYQALNAMRHAPEGSFHTDSLHSRRYRVECESWAQQPMITPVGSWVLSELQDCW